jgi:homoserine O-acetyltransferase
MMDAMDGHDLGQGRGGLASALSKIKIPLFVLALQDDRMISANSLHETINSAQEAGMTCVLDWIESIHGHDSFLIEWPQVIGWLNKLLREVS